MKRDKIYQFIPIILFAGTLIYFSSCEWTKLEPVEISDSDTIYFSEDIIPLLNNSCNMGGCHPANGIPPDLSPENAHFNLLLTGMVDTVAPESSIIYLRMIDTSDPMPPSGVLEYESRLVLNWIKQGAKNN